MYFIQKKISSLFSSSNDSNSNSSSSITTNLNSNTINSDDNTNRIVDHIDHIHVDGSNKIVESDDEYHYYYYNKRQYAIEHTEQQKRQYIELFESTMPVTCAALITSIMAYLFQYIACRYSKQDADILFDECVNIDPIDGISELSTDGQKLLVILTVVYVILSYIFGLIISIKAMNYKRFNKACGCCSHYSASNTNNNNIENIDEVNDSREIKIRKCKNVLYDRIKVELMPWQPSNVSTNFFNALAIENFSFATKNLFLQTILYKVLNPEESFGVNYGFLCWFGSIGLFAVFLNIEYLILPLLKMTRNKHIQERISAFNSDAFCLCFGYSFTILMLIALQSYPSITSYEIESNNCGEGGDDYEPCSKAQVAQYRYQAPVYLAYTVMVIVLAAIFNEFKEEEEEETDGIDNENMTDDRTAFTKFVDCFKEFSSNMKAVQAGAAFFIMYQVILEASGSQGAGIYSTLILALALTFIVPKRVNAWNMSKYRKRKARQAPGLMNCFGLFNEDYNPKFVSNRIILCGRMSKLVLGFSWEEFIFAFFIAVIPNDFGLRLGMIVLVTLVLVILSSRLQDAFDKYLKSIKKYDKLDNIAIQNVVLEL